IQYSTTPITITPTSTIPVLSYNMNKDFNGSTDSLDITRDLAKAQNLTTGAIVVKFKSTSTIPGQSLFTMSDSTNAGTYLSIMLSTGTSGKLRYEVKQNGTQTFGYNTAIFVNDGALHTALISVGSRGVEGYVDGVNVYTVPTSNTFFSSITGENTMNIGKLVTSAGSSWYFNGTIEYVDVYSGELSVAQAQAISTNSYKSTPVLPVNTYNTLAGTLTGGSTIDELTDYTGFMGGPTDGASTLSVNATSAGAYNIAVKYIAADVNRPIKLDINGVNTGTIYILPKTAGWTATDALTFTIPVNLNSGNNTIKFHGDGTNYAPSLGLFTVSAAIIPTTTTLPLGFMTNGARVVSSGAVGYVGGISDSAIFINYNASQAGVYNLTLVGQGSNSPLLIDVNNVNTGTVYKVTVVSPATLTTLTVTVPFNSGNNTIKFHGDGTNYGPDLFTAQFSVNTGTTTTIPTSTVPTTPPTS
ncbi:MAG: sialidase domain-containing protein, partial [Sarcina sp.]